MADAQKPVHPYANRGQRLYHWLDRRTGIGSLLHEALDEPIPGGARWAYVFGSVLLFLFISQTVTGIFLSLYYVPSAEWRAHNRRLHRQGSNRRIISAQLACLRLKRCRHRCASSSDADLPLTALTKVAGNLFWISGCVLFDADAGDGLYRIPVAVGPESLFCHHRRHEYGDRRAACRYLAEAFHARRQRNGNAYRAALFSRPRLFNSSGANRVHRNACLSGSKTRGGRPAERKTRSSAVYQQRRFYPRPVVMNKIVALVMIFCTSIITSATIVSMTTWRG